MAGQAISVRRVIQTRSLARQLTRGDDLAAASFIFADDDESGG
jgi:hypothetical protein